MNDRKLLRLVGKIINKLPAPPAEIRKLKADLKQLQEAEKAEKAEEPAQSQPASGRWTRIWAFTYRYRKFLILLFLYLLLLVSHGAGWTEFVKQLVRQIEILLRIS